MCTCVFLWRTSHCHLVNATESSVHRATNADVGFFVSFAFASFGIKHEYIVIDCVPRVQVAKVCSNWINMLYQYIQLYCAMSTLYLIKL